MLIDTHVHLYDPAFGDFAWPPADSEFHRLLTTGMLRADAEGAVDSCVVVGCSNEYALNAKLLEATAKDPLVGAYIAQLDPTDPECVSYTHRYSMEAKYRGFRVASQTALAHAGQVLAAYRPGTVIELLGNWRYTARWRDIASENPAVPFVIEHFGGYLFDGAPVPEDYRAFCQDFASLANVSIKLSGLYTLCRIFPKPAEPAPFSGPVCTAYSAFGAERCMFGSDWPVMGVPYRQAVEVTRSLIGDDLAADQAFGGTAKRIYRIA